jgi:DNA-binding MarR family transcriptional regulator
MRRRIWQYWIEAEEITTLAIHGVKNRYPYELTPTQLFSSLMLTSGAITHRIDELEKVDLVERAPDPNDRRGTRVKLTDLGLTKINDAVAAHVENERNVLKHLSSKERSLLTSLLRRLLLGLEETSAKQQRGRPGEQDDRS